MLDCVVHFKNVYTQRLAQYIFNCALVALFQCIAEWFFTYIIFLWNWHIIWYVIYLHRYAFLLVTNTTKYKYSGFVHVIAICYALKNYDLHQLYLLALSNSAYIVISSSRSSFCCCCFYCCCCCRRHFSGRGLRDNYRENNWKNYCERDNYKDSNEEANHGE